MSDERDIYIIIYTFKLTVLIFAIIAFMYFAGEALKPLALSILPTTWFPFRMD